MYILLTDHLTCPRCGPDFGLILLAGRIEERRVLEGELGCSNCREQYPVRDGFADLRPRPAPELERPDEEPVPGGREDALRLAGLLGITEGPGFSLVVGPSARLAPGIAELVEGLEVVAVQPELVAWEEQAGVSRMAAGDPLPLATASMRAVALTGPAADALLEDGARVLFPGGRLILDPAPEDVEPRLEALQMKLAARQDDTVVAAPA